MEIKVKTKTQTTSLGGIIIPKGEEGVLKGRRIKEGLVLVWFPRFKSLFQLREEEI